MAEPLPVNPPSIIKQNPNKANDLSGNHSIPKRHLSIGEEAAISQLARLFAMPGLAGDALRLLLAAAKTSVSETSGANLYLLFLVANAEARSRKLRTP